MLSESKAHIFRIENLMYVGSESVKIGKRMSLIAHTLLCIYIGMWAGL